MKLRRLSAENFLRLRAVNLLLPDPITLIAGDNDSGKSSIQEALRLAFTGESARIRLKKNYPLLVRDGADKALVQIEFESAAGVAGVARANLPGGEYACTPRPDPALPFVLDAPRFVRLDAKERRKFLFELVNVQTDIEAIHARLLARGIDDGLTATVIPLLRSGFEAAEKWASDKAKGLRADWCRLTGEDYGAVKAETWSAPVPQPIDDSDFKALTANLASVEAEIEQAAARLGALQESNGRQLAAQPDLNRLKEQSTAFSKTREQVEDAKATAAAEFAELEKLRARADRAGQKPMGCPACGVMLITVDEGLVETEYRDENAVLELRLDLEKKEAAWRALSNGLAMREAELSHMMHAAGNLAALKKGLGATVTDKMIAAAEAEFRELRESRKRLAAEHAAIAIAIEKRDRALLTSTQAYALHGKLQAWKKVEAALGAAGIPGELLSEALGPINARLKRAAAVSGWAEIAIAADMEIVAERRPFELLGESAQWRASAMIAEAIAFLAGIRVLVLDRVDVLSIPNRDKLLNWVDSLVADGYETIMLFATLKSPPQFNGMNSFWLSNGEVA